MNERYDVPLPIKCCKHSNASYYYFMNNEYLSGQIIPSVGIVILTLSFLILERIFPGRDLPNSKGWYKRAILINLCQLGLVGVAGATWNVWFRGYTILHFGNWEYPLAEGLFYWFIGTFIFYWWHRLRHYKNFWVIFHQIHHSASRIEVLTSFYKHPLEIAINSMIIGFMIYTFFGGSPEAGAWYSFFAAGGEYFYHSNLRVPHFFGYFIQTPQLHSIHHQLDVHRYNFGDITWWDRLFGTFKDACEFAPRCGFHKNHEEKIIDMLKFKDVY